jgi:hypothetical protein
VAVGIAGYEFQTVIEQFGLKEPRAAVEDPCFIKEGKKVQ